MINKTSIRHTVPLLLTLSNLAFGFAVIWLALTQRNRFWEDPSGFFTLLAALLLISCLCDFLDGFLARKLKTASPLGLELDSLADLVSFGVAPVVVFYISFFDAKPTIYSFTACLWYLLAGAFRLARFNNNSSQHKTVTNNFEGLPITGACVLWIGLLFFLGQNRGSTLYEDHEASLRRLAIFLFVSLGFLMISHLPYKSFKKTKISNPPRQALRDLLLLILLALLTMVRFGPETLVLAIPLFYIFGTPAAALWKKFHDKIHANHSSNNEHLPFFHKTR